MAILKPQTPAVGIMQTHDWGESKMYTVECECGTEYDSIEFIVEADDLHITVSTYTTQTTSMWNDPFDTHCAFKIKNDWLSSLAYNAISFVNGLHRRVKLTAELWFKGYIKYHQTTILSEQAALNYAETLKSSIKDVKTFKQQRKKKNVS